MLTIAAPADGNWLLSTTSQSAAALVAIVAGFLVSRLVALQAERAGLQSRRDELKADLERRTERLTARLQLLCDEELGDIVEWSMDQLISNPGDLADPLKDALAGGEFATPTQITERLTDAAAVVRQVLDWLKEADSTQTWPADADPVRQAIGAPPWADELVTQTYERAAKARSATLRGKVFFAPTRSRLPSVGVMPKRTPTLAQLEDDVRDARGRLDTVELALAQVQPPPGIWWGFAVLALFASASIALPVIVMADQNRMDLSAGWRLTIALSFGLGLLAVLGYLLYLIQSTTAGSRPPTAPKPRRHGPGLPMDDPPDDPPSGLSSSASRSG